MTSASRQQSIRQAILTARIALAAPLAFCVVFAVTASAIRELCEEPIAADMAMWVSYMMMAMAIFGFAMLWRTACAPLPSTRH